MDEPLKPGQSLLCKLASITVHCDEMMSSDGHEYDKIALSMAVNDPEVREWIDKMTKMGMAPVKRS
jgi:hypothetical protein